jgi:drug/metabolite transporter (DMT)-like permease
VSNLNKSEKIAIFFILLSSVLFSFRAILVKFAYKYDISTIDLLYYRFLFTLPLIWSFALFYKKKEFFIKICNWKIAINTFFAGFFGYYLATLFDFYSLEIINVNISRVILHTFPIYVILWNSLLSKSLPKKRDIINFILIEIFLLLAIDIFDTDFSQTNKIGIFFAFLAAISYSLYYIFNRQIGQKIGSILFTTYSLSFSFFFVNIHFFVIYDYQINLYDLSNEALTVIISMAFFCTFLPLLLISEAISRLGSNRSAIINSSGPVISIILAYIILGEKMNFIQILGSMFVLLLLYKIEIKKNLK